MARAQTNKKKVEERGMDTKKKKKKEKMKTANSIGKLTGFALGTVGFYPGSHDFAHG